MFQPRHDLPRARFVEAGHGTGQRIAVGGTLNRVGVATGYDGQARRVVGSDLTHIRRRAAVRTGVRQRGAQQCDRRIVALKLHGKRRSRNIGHDCLVGQILIGLCAVRQIEIDRAALRCDLTYRGSAQRGPKIA